PVHARPGPIAVVGRVESAFPGPAPIAVDDHRDVGGEPVVIEPPPEPMLVQPVQEAAGSRLAVLSRSVHVGYGTVSHGTHPGDPGVGSVWWRRLRTRPWPSRSR